jgi:hypothetical protein
MNGPRWPVRARSLPWSLQGQAVPPANFSEAGTVLELSADLAKAKSVYLRVARKTSVTDGFK